jgi:hypothetical protein
MRKTGARWDAKCLSNLVGKESSEYVSIGDKDMIARFT